MYSVISVQNDIILNQEMKESSKGNSHNNSKRIEIFQFKMNNCQGEGHGWNHVSPVELHRC